MDGLRTMQVSADMQLMAREMMKAGVIEEVMEETSEVDDEVEEEAASEVVATFIRTSLVVVVPLPDLKYVFIFIFIP